MRVLALSLLLLPAPALAQVDCDATANQAEMTWCANERFVAADAELNDAYGAAVAFARKRGAQQEELLRAAQRAWVSFRDAACSAEGSLYEGGTMQPMVGTDCMARLSLQRADDLWAFASAP